jgi:N utilization substance protein B
MLFAADVTKLSGEAVTRNFWAELGEPDTEDAMQKFSVNLVIGTLRELETVDEKIRTRAEHWRIERMAIVDRNVLRLAVYEFLFEETPNTVVINEALEIARRFSTFEATQFINGILDAIKHDLEKKTKKNSDADDDHKKSQASSN